MNTRQRIDTPTPTAKPANAMTTVAEHARQPILPDNTFSGTKVVVPPKVYPPKIAKAIIAVSRKVQPVQKAGENKFHKYMYPKWEDVLENLGPLLIEHGLIIQQGEVAHEGVSGRLIAITYEFTIINEDGDVWPDRPVHTAICAVEDSKGVKDDKAASKCHTQAQKYFLMGLFKVRTRDMEEADQDASGGNGQQPRKRQVPSPDGTVKPHRLPTNEQTTAESFTEAFISVVKKAKTPEEIEAWDQANDPLIDRVAKANPDTYNKIVDAITTRLAELGATTTQQQNGAVGGLTAQDAQFDPEAWLEELSNVFGGCEDLSSLAEEQEKRMTPRKESVTQAIWAQALSIVQENVKRINEAA